jgi:uncharacterized membrane protein HdeD (DUF308 family)
MTREGGTGISSYWWVLLLTGLFWLLVSLVVLRFDERSITTVGVIIGIVFVLGAANEFLITTLTASWRWLHILVGVLFALGAIWAFTQPEESFWALASVLGFLFVFKGTLDIVVSTASKPVNDLWWLGLVVGILEVLLGFWASQQFYPARAALLLLWVGFGALFRGINEIVLAFRLRSVDDA